MKSEKNIFQHILSWMTMRLRKMGEFDSRHASWLLVVCWLASSVVAVTLAFGYPTGSSWLVHSKDIVLALLLNSFLFVIITVVLAGLFSLMYLPIPRVGLASFMYLATVSVLSLITNKNNVLFLLIGGIGYSMLAVAIGYLIVLVLRKQRLAILITLILVLAGAGSVVHEWMTDDGTPTTQSVATESAEKPVIPNPGEKGMRDYTFFTYGSGTDVQRKEFGELVDEVTPTLDASAIVDKWQDKRTDFWGFDESHLPMNGRVFLPEGKGPFPLILLVHGNHTMEYFSTDGYDYLGKQLASRGFLTISVDEDFINYSHVSGIPSNDYKLRTWVLLHHLMELKARTQSPDSHLYEKINFDEVALVGHSRGGQAAMMAADYDTYFQEETLLEEMKSIQIQAVATLAPTDKDLDEPQPELHNISYLTLHGAKDADVTQFLGERQFDRTTFDPDDEGFKASLYIEKANHTQFNQSWGHRDISLPKGIFLNHRDTMGAADQRQLTKVYLSAFFESVLHGEPVYRPLFANHRYGQNWLPETKLVGKYQDAAYRPILSFSDDDLTFIEADGFKKMKTTTPTYRGGKKHLQDSLLLEWEQPAELTFSLTKDNVLEADQLVLTMANMDDSGEEERVPEVNVEIQTSDGVSVQLPLEALMPFAPIISTDYTPFGLFDNMYRDGKYDQAWEPTFQTFPLSLDRFAQEDTAFQKENITQLNLHFQSYPGKILVEELGVN